ncbi:ectonucleoside triphosphate diphosphohydrolase 2 [Chanos chanos]|uniref:Ectonucleoside triphosphate diphosphohydrolase 2 n=1 Tax=Chanos chanos TaxID=29144 RepID=A0A6J2WSC4_CHACN|nr:ectonucleoside triphosphate diphosphohydrolase 2 [Chanos chanos]
MDNLKCHIVAPVSLLLLGIVGIILLAVHTEDVKDAPQYMYGIVLDAGSSHTAMYIYKWPADKENGTGIVSQHSECHVKGGGISSYADVHGGAGKSLEGCLQQAMTDIPKSKHSKTPIYLGATAGMRLLNLSNTKASNEILQDVSDKLKTKYPFIFLGAAILSGADEGAYGWVTVNYLLENFIKYDFAGQWISPSKKTVGALDFGGASTQITFETADKVEDEGNKKTLRLYGRDYTLYTQSFLCYGRDQVLRQILANLAKNQNYATSISHPCYPADYNVSMELGKIFDSPCTQKKRPSPYDAKGLIQVQGTGNYQQCVGNVSAIFDLKKCSFSSCSFNDVFQPKVSGNFMAFSAFFYTYSFLQRSTGISVSSPELMEGAAQAVCNMSFEEMEKKVPDQKTRLQDYCSVSVFIQILTLKGYRFDQDSFPRISFQKKAGDTSIGWALGYMLSKSNLIPSESIPLRKALSSGAWTGLLFLFILILAALPVYVILRAHFKRKGGAPVV